MTISELIKELVKTMDKHGDVRVIHESSFNDVYGVGKEELNNSEIVATLE